MITITPYSPPNQRASYRGHSKDVSYKMPSVGIGSSTNSTPSVQIGVTMTHSVEFLDRQRHQAIADSQHKVDSQPSGYTPSRGSDGLPSHKYIAGRWRATPSLKAMQGWLDSGVARDTAGKRCDLDGDDSWLVHLGLI